MNNLKSMLIRTLTTAGQVVTELGGTFKVAALTGVKPPAISNSIKKGQFARGHYVVMTRALKAKRATAPASLWGMSEGVKARAS